MKKDVWQLFEQTACKKEMYNMRETISQIPPLPAGLCAVLCVKLAPQNKRHPGISQNSRRQYVCNKYYKKKGAFVPYTVVSDEFFFGNRAHTQSPAHTLIVARIGVHNTQRPRRFVYSSGVILVVAERVDAVVAGGSVQAIGRFGVEPRVHGLHAHPPAGGPITTILHHVEAVPRARNRTRLGHDPGRAASSVCRHAEGRLLLRLPVLLVAPVENGAGHEGGDGGQDANDEPGHGALA